MRVLRSILFCCISLFALGANSADNRNLVTKPIQADGRRVALVIGNGAYKEAPLRNPTNDADDIASTLKSLGFEVIARKNAGQKEIKTAIREFGQRLRGAEAGLFFFAGHGLQVKGVNYLVPVASDIQSEADAEDQSVSLDYVMRTMEEGGAKFNIAILDACRNNPLTRSFRSVSRGLAQTQAATGTLIAYSTAPGSVASDGSGRNGVYTKHLVRSLKEVDGDILRVFQRVRTSVVQETNGTQTPWESISLVGDFFFNSRQTQQIGVPSMQATSSVRVATPEEIEQEAWNVVRDSTNRRDFENYLDAYPAGRFAPLARMRVSSLERGAGSSPTTLIPHESQSPAGNASSRSIQVSAPDIAENGAVVPVAARFDPPLRSGETAEIYFDSMLVTRLSVLDGELSNFSTRFRLASGTILVRASDNSSGAKSIAVTKVGDDRLLARKPPSLLEGPFIQQATTRIRVDDGVARMLAIGTFSGGRLEVSSSNMKVAMTGSTFYSLNPFFQFNTNIRKNESLDLRIAR